MLINSKGDYKIADFGLALDNAIDGGRSSFVCGTPVYLHPDIYELLKWRTIWGEKRLPYRNWPNTTSDIWAFAIMTFEASCGRLPFNAESPKVMHQIMKTKTRYDICGFEDMDGWIVRSNCIPHHANNGFYADLLKLLARLLKANVDELPSFQQFFILLNEFLSSWRYHFN